MAPADRLQSPPDRARRSRRRRPTLPRSLQLRLRPHSRHRPRLRRLRHEHPPQRRGQTRLHPTLRLRLLHVVERRPPHHDVFSQHARPPHRDRRQPHADGDSPRPLAPAPHLRHALPHHPAEMALRPVHRLFPFPQLRRPRLRRPPARLPPLQYVAHGQKLHRARQPRHLDALPEPHRSHQSRPPPRQPRARPRRRALRGRQPLRLPQ